MEVFLTHSVTRLDKAIHLKSGCIPTKGLCCPYRTGLYAFVVLSGVVKGVEVSASRVSAFWARAGLSAGCLRCFISIAVAFCWKVSAMERPFHSFQLMNPSMNRQRILITVSTHALPAVQIPVGFVQAVPARVPVRGPPGCISVVVVWIVHRPLEASSAQGVSNTWQRTRRAHGAFQAQGFCPSSPQLPFCGVPMSNGR